MPVVLLIAAAVILGGVIIVAIGRGGELTRFPADVSPFDAEIVTAADVVLLRPPSALFGYNRQVADDALSAIARTISERDVEIATLRRQLADLRAQSEPRAATDPSAASGSWPGPAPRPSLTRRTPAAAPGPPPQPWSAWSSPAPASPLPRAPASPPPAADDHAAPAPPGQPVPGADVWTPRTEPADRPAPDPNAAGDAR